MRFMIVIVQRLLAPFVLGAVLFGATPAAFAQPDPAPVPTTPPPVPTPAPAAATGGATPDGAALELRKLCADAMTKNPTFAADIVKSVDASAAQRAQKQFDDATVKAHADAQDRVAKNEKHVILAYASMWLVAAGFLLFLWRRQQALKSEIVQLRRDLDAAAKDAT